jgi:hypothetical protein
MLRPSHEAVLDAFLDEPAHPAPTPVVVSRVDRATYDVAETLEDLVRRHQSVTPVDLVITGAASTTPREVDDVALLSLVLFDHTTCLTPLRLPDGRVIASLHAHVTRWRTRPGGFVDAETVTSGQLARGRTPIEQP